MISSAYSALKQCWTDQTAYQDVGSTKKDDDFGKNEIHQWIATHPINSGMYNWTSTKMIPFVNQLIDDLPKPKLTEANIGLVESHFVSLANISERSRTTMLEQLRKSNLNQSLKQKLSLVTLSTNPENV